MSSKDVTYRYISIKGSAYEAGRQLAEYLKKDQDLIRLLSSPFMGGDHISKEHLEQVKDALETYCPGTNEEIKGFADALSIDPAKIVYYYTYLFPRACNCSQLAVSADLMDNHHTYLARNYEYSWDDSPILMETAIEGQYRQIGFACQLFGRFDGMNEHGLCIATSAGVINGPYNEEGFVFPVAVRAILNRCKTVPEALALFDTIPFADYRNFCITDRLGNIARIQAAASVKVAEQGSTNNKYLAAANHYESNLLKEKNYYAPKHSITRLETINHYLANIEHKGKSLKYNEIVQLFTKPMPEGVCCHYYEDGVGTMWSEIFDATERTMKVCFGSPDDHEWQTFSFTSTKGMKEYQVSLSSVKAEDDFWSNTNA